MTDPKTLSVLAIVATLGSVLTVTVLEYRAAMAKAEAVRELEQTCRKCLETTDGRGGCSVVCGRIDRQEE
jgi:type II secretory pathway pseudopilin PulG